ncbi:Plant UBX domain-containing protein 12 [Hirschfeldia incana]|nr:Plant UBX domain-containing protein 12 [Hirschfeldia incana]
MAKRSFRMLECQSLVENLSPFVDTKRPKRSSDIAAPTASTTTTCLFPEAVIGYPELSEGPNSDLDRSGLCRICVRLPDGRRVQRSFLRSESVQLLWSFCYSQIDQSERNKPFKLFQAIPGYYKTLCYGPYTSFEQSGLANSLVSVTWM